MVRQAGIPGQYRPVQMRTDEGAHHKALCPGPVSGPGPHLTERQRDAILRLLGTSGGPRIVIFQRFYDYLELDRLYAEYGRR